MVFATRMDQLGTESAFEVLARAKALEAEGRDVVHLEIGQPDFSTPDNICRAAYEAMKQGHTGYAPSAGLDELRNTVADHITQTRGILVNASEVTITPGAKPIILFTMLACVNAGDEVIYPDPGFPIYRSLVDFLSAVPRPLPLRESVDFRFRIEDLVDLASDRTKLLIINSPQNPTGGVLTREDLEIIAELANRHDFYVLSDEIYANLVYEGQHESILSVPGMKERTVLLDGHSKTYAMTGWRLGYSVSTSEMSEKITRLMINSNSCTATFTQIAGVEALKNSSDFVDLMFGEFQRRREVIVDGLNSIEGISCIRPQGAFYAFPNVKNLPLPCSELSNYLLNDAGVAVLSGDSFGEMGDGYLRVSYANSIENIQIALDRIQESLAKL